MFFDLFFFGLPVGAAILLGVTAVQKADNRFWRACFCLVAWSAYYLAGGREVLIYLTLAALMGLGLAGAGGAGAG